MSPGLHSCSSSDSQAHKQENAKSMLGKLHAQHFLERPTQKLTEPRQTCLQKFCKCLASKPMKLDTIFLSQLQKRRNELTFQNGLKRSYGSQHSTKDQAWCPVLGQWRDVGELEGIHLFDSMHGQDTMNTLSGNSHWNTDLHSSHNGLLMHHRITEAFDSGKVVIVPDTETQSITWRNKWGMFQRPQEYKLYLIDPTGNHLNEKIQFDINTTWRELNGKRLEFRTKFRPNIQYLYFHYCLQLLRRAWQYKGLSTNVLEEELDKSLWKFPGSFLPKNMLAVFVKELGPDYETLLRGSTKKFGQSQDPQMLLYICSWQIVGWQCKWILSDGGDSADGLQGIPLKELRSERNVRSRGDTRATASSDSLYSLWEF